MSDIFDYPAKYEELVRTYTPGPIFAALILPVVLNVVPDLLVASLPGTTHASFAPHLTSPDGPTSPAVWLLTLLQLPAILVAGYYLRRRQQRAFHVSYFVQGILQFLWLQLLAWRAIPYFPLIGVAVLFGGMIAWAFNETFFHYDALQPRLEFFLAFVVFDALLLALDAAGGQGLLWAWRNESSFVVNMLGVQGVLILVTQVLLHFVGRAQRLHDARVAEIAVLERDLALAQKERHVVQRLCDVLDHGVSAARFSKDISSPVVSMDEAALGLRELMDEVPPPDVITWRKRVELQLSELKSASQRVMEMTRLVARSVRGAEPLAEKPVDALVRASVDATRAILGSPASLTPPPLVDCHTSSVWVTPNHTADLATVLVSHAAHGGATRLEIRGAVLGEHYYHLTIRDRVVEGAARDAVLARLRPALALEEPPRQDEADRLGFGLELSKISVVRHHGWLEVAAAHDGPGLVVHVLLPRRPPADIPAWAKNPAELLRGSAPRA